MGTATVLVVDNERKIRDTVLRGRVHTPEQFARWLVGNGFPSLDAAGMGTHAR